MYYGIPLSGVFAEKSGIFVNGDSGGFGENTGVFHIIEYLFCRDIDAVMVKYVAEDNTERNNFHIVLFVQIGGEVTGGVASDLYFTHQKIPLL